MSIKQFNRPSVHIVILVLTVFIFYAHTFDAGFVFDDYSQQGILTLIKSGEKEMNIFNFITTPEEVRYYTQVTSLPWWTSPKWRIKYFRPVATLSHFIDFSLWGSNPLPYHINNVIWYALLVVLLYVLYRSFCHHGAMAFCGALVFAVEPCHYLAVRWLANRNDIICATFLVLSFICYIRFCRERRYLYCILFVFSYLLALLTKELAFIFPILIFAYDWIRCKGFKEIMKGHGNIYLFLVIINTVYFAFYAGCGYGSYWYEERSLWYFLLEFLKAATLYLNSLFYCISTATVSTYIFPRYWFIFVLLLLFLLYLLYLIWEKRKFYPEVNLFMLWIFLPLPLMIVPPITDRLLLIPSIGYAYLVALVIFKLGRKRLALFFVIIGLFYPLVIGIIQPRIYDEVLQSNYEQLYGALDEIVVQKTSQDRLFFLNFPRAGFAGESYMYLGLYYDLYYHYRQWRVPVYPLSAFDSEASVKLLDDHHIKISHPKRFYFETNLERLFSLDRSFSKGEIFQMPDVKISIDEMEGERVKSIEFEFDRPVEYPYYYFLFFDEGKWQRWYPLTGGSPFENQ